MPESHGFPVVQSQVDLNAPQYKPNRNAWSPVVKRFEASLQETASEGDERSLRRHQGRGQLLGLSPENI